MKKCIGMIVAMLTVGIVLGSPVSAYKFICPDGSESDTGDTTGCSEYGSENNQNNLMETLTGIINVIIGIVGFLAVVMIIIGGISYTTSAGDASKVKKAKDTIMYGIIGLIVAILAFAIVNFVLGAVVGGGGTS